MSYYVLFHHESAQSYTIPNQSHDKKGNCMEFIVVLFLSMGIKFLFDHSFQIWHFAIYSKALPQQILQNIDTLVGRPSLKPRP